MQWKGAEGLWFTRIRGLGIDFINVYMVKKYINSQVVCLICELTMDGCNHAPSPSVVNIYFTTTLIMVIRLLEVSASILVSESEHFI